MARRRAPFSARLAALGALLGVAAVVTGCASPAPNGSGGSTTAAVSPAASSLAPLASALASPAPSDVAAGASPTPSLPAPVSVGANEAPVGPISIGTASAHGRVLRMSMAAPWKGGRATQANVAVYLPPNFDPSGATRYPVIYEAPYGISTWSQPHRFNLPRAMDYLIGKHLIPPEIVVMLGTSGGPYLDSECANSYDKRAWIETWIVKTVVPWMDSHYPTVASRVGRAFMGASQGGYCAAALWSHRPDVFGAALILSGYFTSGVTSSQTPYASRPFGGNAAYEASQSPINRVPGIAATLRTNSLVLLEANPANWFYGRQLTAFTAVLAQSQVPYRLYADPLGHSWPAFGRDTPRLLVDLARWMAARGVA